MVCLGRGNHSFNGAAPNSKGRNHRRELRKPKWTARMPSRARNHITRGQPTQKPRRTLDQMARGRPPAIRPQAKNRHRNQSRSDISDVKKKADTPSSPRKDPIAIKLVAFKPARCREERKIQAPKQKSKTNPCPGGEQPTARSPKD